MQVFRRALLALAMVGFSELAKYPDTAIAVEGHTDVGSAAYNQKLSTTRAEAGS
jgi:outer membrane protein OmpA-like peptidoglycan-associated protein